MRSCSVAQSCPTFWDPMGCSTPDFPVLHHLPELSQTQVHWVGEAIQPSHPLSLPSPPAFNLSQQMLLPSLSCNKVKVRTFSTCAPATEAFAPRARAPPQTGAVPPRTLSSSARNGLKQRWSQPGWQQTWRWERQGRAAKRWTAGSSGVPNVCGLVA